MSWNHEGDMARAVARQMQAQYLEKVAAEGGEVADQGPVMLADSNSILSKITFRWRSDEESQLVRIRAAADSVVTNMYRSAHHTIDDFYGQLRIAEQHPDTGMVVRDQAGRIVWQTDERGREVEDWSQLTGQDIEACLLNLERIKLGVAPRVNELLMEAVFAKHIFDDRFEEAYAELVEETIPGRKAYAARKTQQDKYHAFFCYYLWSTAKTVLAEIENFCRILERVRYWRIEESKYGKKTSFL